ncbi:MAG: hypothetical protein QXH61_06685 [Candidatus Nezhaarchaeales archaeon]
MVITWLRKPIFLLASPLEIEDSKPLLLPENFKEEMVLVDFYG